MNYDESESLSAIPAVDQRGRRAPAPVEKSGVVSVWK